MPGLQFLKEKQSSSEFHTPAQELYEYLQAEMQTARYDASLAENAWTVWQALSNAMCASLPIPDASVGEDGQVLYTWDKGEHHFEAEILPNGSLEYFYRNRTTGDLWEAEQQRIEQVPDGVKNKLALFANV